MREAWSDTPLQFQKVSGPRIVIRKSICDFLFGFVLVYIYIYICMSYGVYIYTFGFCELPVFWHL